MFELGPPVMLDAATLKTMKISRFERVGYCALLNFLYFLLYLSCTSEAVIVTLVTVVLRVPHTLLNKIPHYLYASVSS